MKLLKHNSGDISLIAYKSLLILYGVRIKSNEKRYNIELVLPLFFGSNMPFKIYSKKKKPYLKNMIALNALAMPAFIIHTLAFLTFITTSFILNFPYQILIKKSFLSEKWEFLSGWLWISFAVYGAIQIINRF